MKQGPQFQNGSRYRDLLAFIDSAVPEQISVGTNEYLNTIYDFYVSEFYSSESGPVTPENFVEFWRELSREDKIGYLSRLF